MDMVDVCNVTDYYNLLPTQDQIYPKLHHGYVTHLLHHRLSIHTIAAQVCNTVTDTECRIMMVNECSWTKVGTILLTVIYEKMRI